MGVFDGFLKRPAFPVQLDSALFCEVTVAHVQGAIAALDDGGIVIASHVAGHIRGVVPLDMAFPLPGPTLVVGERHGQTVAPLFEIVMDQYPLPVFQGEHLRARPRIGQL